MSSNRKLATIAKIEEIHPIKDADSIERVIIRGWNVVVKKGEFSPGDYCVYCEIDSVLPERPEFEFLRPRNFRIRTIKLKGQISQGIAFPLDILKHNEWDFGLISIIPDVKEPILSIIKKGEPLSSGIDLIDGLDVTEILGITKYEPPIPAELSGIVKGAFPSHSIKTDEERIQNLKDNYEDYKKEIWYETEKLDGTSSTFYFGIMNLELHLEIWRLKKMIRIHFGKWLVNYKLKKK